jgi:exonuclease SbcC
MITRIELNSFMSHARTVIEPAAGLTVIVGANNLGKSAIVSALQILCQNQNSTYVTRHGERECAVMVQTDDGHAVEWRRKNDSPRYVVDGVLFDRLGGCVPDEVHNALRLPLVEWESQEFDVHLAPQKSPIFLLDKPGTHAAQFFASSSDAIHLVAMQKRHREKVTAAQRERNALGAHVALLNRQMELLEPVVELDRELAETEKAFKTITKQTAQIDAAERHASDLRREASTASAHASVANALADLAPPPELTAIEPLSAHLAALERTSAEVNAYSARTRAMVALNAPPALSNTRSFAALIDDISSTRRRLADEAGRAQTLKSLREPPHLCDDRELARMVRALQAGTDLAARCQAFVERLSPLVSGPSLAETEGLETAIDGLVSRTDDVAAWEREVREASAVLAVAEEEFRRRAMDFGQCPTCGQPLDTDRLVTLAAMGLARH